MAETTEYNGPEIEPLSNWLVSGRIATDAAVYLQTALRAGVNILVCGDGTRDIILGTLAQSISSEKRVIYIAHKPFLGLRNENLIVMNHPLLLPPSLERRTVLNFTLRQIADWIVLQTAEETNLRSIFDQFAGSCLFSLGLPDIKTAIQFLKDQSRRWAPRTTISDSFGRLVSKVPIVVGTTTLESGQPIIHTIVELDASSSTITPRVIYDLDTVKQPAGLRRRAEYSNVLERTSVLQMAPESWLATWTRMKLSLPSRSTRPSTVPQSKAVQFRGLNQVETEWVHWLTNEVSSPSGKEGEEQQWSDELSKRRIAPSSLRQQDWEKLEIKIRNIIGKQLKSDLDINNVSEVRRFIEDLYETVLAEEGIVLPRSDRKRLFYRVLSEGLGFGPIEALLQDGTITEILINGPKDIHVEVRGTIRRIPMSFDNDEHLKRKLTLMLDTAGRPLSISNPEVEGRLADGTRVNAAVPPVSRSNTLITLRKHLTSPISVEKLVELGAISPEAAEFLKASIIARLNILISGSASSGKTTLINTLSAFMPRAERIICIEKTAELQLPQEHVLRLEARPENWTQPIQGWVWDHEGAELPIPITNAHRYARVITSDLVQYALRMRPDRCIIGEIDPDNIASALLAFNSVWTMATVQVVAAGDVIATLASMLSERLSLQDIDVVQKRILRSLDIIIHCARNPSGQRIISDVNVIEGSAQRQVVPVFTRAGASRLAPTGHFPLEALETIEDAGIHLPPSVFGIGERTRY